jgi:hypothetical protein
MHHGRRGRVDQAGSFYIEEKTRPSVSIGAGLAVMVVGCRASIRWPIVLC